MVSFRLRGYFGKFKGFNEYFSHIQVLLAFLSPKKKSFSGILVILIIGKLGGLGFTHNNWVKLGLG